MMGNELSNEAQGLEVGSQHVQVTRAFEARLRLSAVHPRRGKGVGVGRCGVTAEGVADFP